MNRFTVLIESRPFCVFDHTAMEKLEKEDIDIIDMRGSGIEDTDFVEALKIADSIIREPRRFVHKCTLRITNN